MHSTYHDLIGAAADLPINSAQPVLSFSPVVLSIPDRPVDLDIRVTVPTTGDKLPIILFSHGHGKSNYLSSLEGYAPLAEFWAAHGFAVLQPTHLGSSFLGLKSAADDMFYKQRAEDMVHILDRLNTIEQAVPGLNGRLDHGRIAVAGHSAGSWTASMLLGATNTDPRDGSTWHKPEKRIQAGIVMAAIGNGGNNLTENGQRMVPFYGGDFKTMDTPTLVVCGDDDISPQMTVRGADWLADAYTLAPGKKDLLILKGAKHGLGGISGWDARETLDESPERLAVVQRMTWAYLQSQFYEGDVSWEQSCKTFNQLDSQGSIESK